MSKPIDNALYRAAEAAYEASVTDEGAELYWNLPDCKREMWVAHVWTEELDEESYPNG